MTKVTLDEIKSFVAGAIERSGGRKSHRSFLIQDKKTLVEMLMNSKASINQIARTLGTISRFDSEAKWVGRINAWTTYYKAGRLDVEKAVAIQKPKVETLGITGSRLKAVVQEYLKYGVAAEEILRIVESECSQHSKSKLIEETKEYLKARGLTIQDLQ